MQSRPGVCNAGTLRERQLLAAGERSCSAGELLPSPRCSRGTEGRELGRAGEPRGERELGEGLVARGRVFAPACVFARGRVCTRLSQAWTTAPSWPLRCASSQPVLTRYAAGKNPPCADFLDATAPASCGACSAAGAWDRSSPARPRAALCRRGPSVPACSVPSRALPRGNSVSQPWVCKGAKPTATSLQTSACSPHASGCWALVELLLGLMLACLVINARR